MYYELRNPKRKQEFTNQMNQQIKVYENIIQGLETCKPIIKSFDGKVANVKLIKAIQAEDNPNKLSYKMRLRAWESTMELIITDSFNRMYPSVDNVAMNCVDFYRFVFLLPTTKPDRFSQDRINAEETLKKIELEKNYYMKLIEGCKTDLQMYDEEIDAWEELTRQVETYEKKFSPRLRGSITMRK